jgi:tetratricopeptide (TPR) repeat protein
MKHVLPALTLLLMLFPGLTGALAQGTAAQDPLVAKGDAALAAKNWPEAETVFKQLVASEPTNLEAQRKLVAAQLAQGHDQDALVSCDKAIAIAQKSAAAAPPADAETVRLALGSLLTTRGNILLKQKKTADAVAAYEQAAAISPNPGVAYFNICATLYNQGDMKDAVAACDKAIAADPTKADAYFVKGSALFGDGTVQNGKFVVPAAAVQALQKYLALAPNGPHVADVKAMLDAVGR